MKTRVLFHNAAQTNIAPNKKGYGTNGRILKIKKYG